MQSHRPVDGEADALHGSARAYALAELGVTCLQSGSRRGIAIPHSRDRKPAPGRRCRPKARWISLPTCGDPLPAIVTAEMLGVPLEDRHQLKAWSANFAEMLGNFQHNPEHAPRMLRTVQEMTAYFHDTHSRAEKHPREGSGSLPYDCGSRWRPVNRGRSCGHEYRDHGRRPGDDDESDWQRCAHAAAQSRRDRKICRKIIR